MRKWANLIFTSLAVLGWAALATIAVDAIFNNGKLITKVLIGL